jgi:hypothetical protein
MHAARVLVPRRRRTQRTTHVRNVAPKERLGMSDSQNSETARMRVSSGSELSAAVVRAALTRAMNMRPRSRHGARCTHARTEWRSPRGTVVDYMARQPSRLRLIGAAIAKTDRVERRIERPLKLRERRRLRQDTRQVASKRSSDDPSKLAIHGMKQAQRPDHALR